MALRRLAISVLPSSSGRCRRRRCLGQTGTRLLTSHSAPVCTGSLFALFPLSPCFPCLLVTMGGLARWEGHREKQPRLDRDL